MRGCRPCSCPASRRATVAGWWATASRRCGRGGGVGLMLHLYGYTMCAAAAQVCLHALSHAQGTCLPAYLRGCSRRCSSGWRRRAAAATARGCGECQPVRVAVVAAAVHKACSARPLARRPLSSMLAELHPRRTWQGSAKSWSRGAAAWVVGRAIPGAPPPPPFSPLHASAIVPHTPQSPPNSPLPALPCMQACVGPEANRVPRPRHCRQHGSYPSL